VILTAAACLALNVYFEARSESITGQQMIAEVTMNRVDSDKYPNTVCDVVYQNRQFSWTQDGKSDTPRDAVAWKGAQAVAHEALDGDRLGSEALYYHADYVSPGWAKRLTWVGQVGQHQFYK